MRAAAAIVVQIALLGAASADGPPRSPVKTSKPADCAGFSHPDEVVAAIERAKSCGEGVGLFHACQVQWVNNPAMEEAAVNACDNRMRKLSDAEQERYETLREACETRYQAPDMRILWSAVRVCKVRLAEQWARRYPAR
jgi:hypothetical protein